MLCRAPSTPPRVRPRIEVAPRSRKPLAARRQHRNAAVASQQRYAITAYGPYYPGFVDGSVETGLVWVNPLNARTEDGANATNGTTGTGTTAPLRASAFGMVIPTGAIVKGLLVEVKKTGSTGVTDSSVAGTGAQLLTDATNSASKVGTDHGDVASDWPAALAWVPYGGPTDDWAAGLTPANLNSSLFAFEISAALFGAGAWTVGVDAIRITVYAAGSASPQPYVRPGVKVVASRRPPFRARRRHKAQPIVLPAAPRRSPLLAFFRQAVLVTRRRKPPQARRHHQATIVRPPARPAVIVFFRQALEVTRRARPTALLARRRHRNAATGQSPKFATPTPLVRHVPNVTRQARPPLQARRRHKTQPVVLPAPPRRSLLVAFVRQAITITRRRRPPQARRHHQAILVAPPRRPLAFFRPAVTVTRRTRQAIVARRRHHQATIVEAPRFKTATRLAKPTVVVVRHARQALVARRRHGQAGLGKGRIAVAIRIVTGHFGSPAPGTQFDSKSPGVGGFDAPNPDGPFDQANPHAGGFDAPNPDGPFDPGAPQ